MNAPTAAFFERLACREPAQRLLRRMGLDPQQFVLFLGLFRTLSEREELTGAIGANRFNLSYLAIYAAAMGALPWSLMACSSMPAPIYLIINLFLVFALTFLIIIREAANILFNPIGISIFAHNPVHSPTYAAARIAHILLAVLYLIAGLTLYPALIGIGLKGAHWFWLITHLTAAFLIGLWTAFLICAFYSWLSRLVPAYLIKSISTWIQLISFIAFIAIPVCFPESVVKLAALRFEGAFWAWLPLTSFVKIGLLGCQGVSWRAEWRGALAIAATIVIVWIGFRNFSGDYLFKTSSMVQGIRGRNPRKTAISRGVAAMLRMATGSPVGLSAFYFTSQMMRRDWQFRRTILAQTWLLLIIMLAMMVAVARADAPPSPFSGDNQSFIHALPHFLGLITLALCANIGFTDFFSGSWIYLISPVGNFRSFAGGIFLALWIPSTGVPHIVMLPFLIHFWGWEEGALAAGFSLIVVSLYLAFAMNRISGLPFSAPLNESLATRNTINIQICCLMAIFFPIALHSALFQLQWVAFGAGITLLVFACFVMRWTLGEVESAMRWNLHTMKAGANQIFEEIE